jgi:hypothetical protein
MSGFDLRGYTVVGSGTLPTGSAFERVDDAWENMWLRLLEKAESPPFNYTAPTQTLNDDTAVREYFEMILGASWNLSILHQLMNLVTYNEGMNTLSDDFRGKFRRINDLMVHMRSVRSIPLIDHLLDKFCHVVLPYNGGPVYAIIHDLYEMPWTGTNPATNWGTAIDLDRGVTASDVVALMLDDIEEAYEELTGQAGDSAAEVQRADFRQIVNILAALGMPTLALSEKREVVDPELFIELQFTELFHFYHSETADTHDIGYPVAADAEAMIHRAFPSGYSYDWRDFISFLPSAVKDGETAAHGDDNIIYGIMCKCSSRTNFTRQHRIYTAEDGWFSKSSSMDLADVDIVQDYVWSVPWLSRHIYGSKAIAHEDPEEDFWLYGPGMYREFDQRHDDLGKGLFRAIHESQYGGFDVPVIR